MSASILVVDDENTTTDALQLLLSDNGYDVIVASTAEEAETLLARRWFDLVFLDLRLPDADGIGLLEHIKLTAPETEVVLMTAHGSLEVTIEAIKRGAFYYLEKPFTFDQVLLLAAASLAVQRDQGGEPAAKERASTGSRRLRDRRQQSEVAPGAHDHSYCRSV